MGEICGRNFIIRFFLSSFSSAKNPVKRSLLGKEGLWVLILFGFFLVSSGPKYEQNIASMAIYQSVDLPRQIIAMTDTRYASLLFVLC